MSARVTESVFVFVFEGGEAWAVGVRARKTITVASHLARHGRDSDSIRSGGQSFAGSSSACTGGWGRCGRGFAFCSRVSCTVVSPSRLTSWALGL